MLIGRSLCRSAFWDEKRELCNWIGRASSERSDYGGPVTPTVTALGPGFYGGSTGVALFLAQLFSMTGDEDARLTAAAAIRRSIRRLDRVATIGPPSPLSFHLGHLGVAVTALKIGALISAAGFDAEVASILDRVLETADTPQSLDVIEGSAGAIPALLGLAREWGLENCRGLAIAVGEDLCRRKP